MEYVCIAIDCAEGGAVIFTNYEGAIMNLFGSNLINFNIINNLFRGGLIDFLQELLYTVPIIIISLTFHEWGHAYAAYRMGDPTAKNEGRMTLNPFAHIDLLGFLLLILVGFGWAKPVPVNPRNYRNYKKGETVVSLAGVSMNFVLAILSALILSIIMAVNKSHPMSAGVFSRLYVIFYYMLSLNCAHIAFNLLPIYPLDGFHVAEVLLAKHIGYKPFMFLRKYGSIILFAVILIPQMFGFSLIGLPAHWLADGLLKLFFLIFGI